LGPQLRSNPGQDFRGAEGGGLHAVTRAPQRGEKETALRDVPPSRNWRLWSTQSVAALSASNTVRPLLPAPVRKSSIISATVACAWGVISSASSLTSRRKYPAAWSACSGAAAKLSNTANVARVASFAQPNVSRAALTR